MYKQLIDPITNEVKVGSILRTADMAYIPFDPANTDYANFKKEILADEAQLQDADGKTMTANKAKEFVATLP
jgi:hypothetical protein